MKRPCYARSTTDATHRPTAVPPGTRVPHSELDHIRKTSRLPHSAKETVTYPRTNETFFHGNRGVLLSPPSVVVQVTLSDIGYRNHCWHILTVHGRHLPAKLLYNPRRAHELSETRRPSKERQGRGTRTGSIFIYDTSGRTATKGPECCRPLLLSDGLVLDSQNRGEKKG